MKSFEAIAQAAYQEFYRTLEGHATQISMWEKLPQFTRDAWIAASRKMAEEIQQVH